MIVNPDDIERRIIRRCRPHIEQAIAEQDPAARDLIATADALDELQVQFTASRDQDWQITVHILIGIQDHTGAVRPFLRIPGPEVGVETRGRPPSPTAGYRPSPEYDPDLPPDVIDLPT